MRKATRKLCIFFHYFFGGKKSTGYKNGISHHPLKRAFRREAPGRSVGHSMDEGHL